MQNNSNADGIVLLAKRPGPTSFASLKTVKKALGTNKVGHTGTLDSFAQGLLVVCTGRLTKLAGRITEFDKTYEAVIHFGSETDTLEYTGNVIKTAPLPTEEELRDAVKKWTGEIMQKPPMFSAIHVDGKRASDLARSGKDVEIPARRVTVFSAEIKELQFAEGDNGSPICTGDLGVSGESLQCAGNLGRRVEYAHIVFSVSKGTYIRSLARDIAESCGSAAHLVGLYRTKVGSFKIEDAAGFDTLGEFNIETAIENQRDWECTTKDAKSGKFGVCVANDAEIGKISENVTQNAESVKCNTKSPKSTKNGENVLQNDEFLQKEIISKKQQLIQSTAKLCGFETICLKNNTSLEKFCNGKPLKSELFETSLWDYPCGSEIAVFFEEDFCGVINKNTEGKVSYGFVLS